MSPSSSWSRDGALVQVLMILTLVCCSVAGLCPVVKAPGYSEIQATDVAASRVSVRFNGLIVDVSSVGVTGVITNLSQTLVAKTVSTAYVASGLEGRDSPQGLFYRYASRLPKMIASGAIVQLMGSSSTALNFSVAWTLDQLYQYDIARDELIELYFPPAFFMAAVNGSTAALPSCITPILFATIRIKQSYTASGYMAFTSVTTLLSMIATGIFGWRHPGKSMDPQTMISLSFSGCAEPYPRILMGAYRLLAPFALSEDLGGMLAGNCIAIAAVWVIGWVAAIVVGKAKGAKTLEQAGSFVFFPRIPFLFMMAIYQGTCFCATRLFATGVIAGNGSQLAGGIVASIVFVLVVPALTYMYALRGILGEFHTYQTQNVNVVWKFFVPSGYWMPKTVRHACGGVMGELQREERVFVLLVFLSPILSSVVLGPLASTPNGCMAQYVVFLTFQMVLVVLNVWFAPWRSKLDTCYCVMAHVLLACCGALYASSASEEVTVVSLQVPQVILLVISWLRLGNDALTALMDHSGLAFAGRLFFWHDGTRGDVDNAYEIKQLDASRDDDDVLKEQSLEPFVSPLASLPSMVKPSASQGLSDILQNGPPPKKPNDDLFDDDPFKDDDDPFGSKKPSAAALKSPPSSVKGGSFSSKPKTDFDSDEDPFNPKPKTEKKESKIKGIAKKILLAAKLKGSIAEHKEQREQQEMFGDKEDVDDLLRPKGHGGSNAYDDGNDVLGTLGINTALNPMGTDGGGGFAANQASSGRKIAGGDLAQNLMGKEKEKKKEEEAAVQVFRVEYSTKDKRMSLVAQPENEFGSFFDGDSYVVLNNQPARGKTAAFKELFVWIGSVSTPDEIRAAVTEAVTLDNKHFSSFSKGANTGGHKITRVLQGNETTNLTAIFPGQSIRVVEGGIDGEGGVQCRLYHVHGEGAKKMNLTQVPPTIESLDDGDVFVFDCEKDVYIFQGSSCSPFEREHGRQYGEKLRQSRVQCVVSVVTQDTAPDKFWKLLGSSKKAAQEMTLQRVENFLPSSINRMWVVRGPNDFKLEASGDDVCLMSLKNDKVMIIDCCSVVYAWVGSNCSPYKEQRDNALQRGVEYLKKHSEEKVPLIRVVENFEGETFHDLVPEAPIDL